MKPAPKPDDYRRREVVVCLACVRAKRVSCVLCAGLGVLRHA